MPNNPVQIVLNDELFLRAPDPGQAGPEKDFFQDHDAAFMAHRARLLEQLSTIAAGLEASPYGPLTYLHVRMRNEAIAKSYRPNRAVFMRDQFPCVGAGAPGELYFRAPLFHFHRLISRIASAEDHGQTRRSSRTGEPYHFVTRVRSEVGAIETIELITLGQKRGFAASDAVAAFADPRAASGYIVELFEQAPLTTQGADDVLGFRRSVETLNAAFLQGGRGLRADLLPTPGSVPVFEVLLTRGSELPRLEDRRVMRTDSASDRNVVPVDLDVARHERFLQQLSAHPLVRRIRFPVLIEATAASGTSLDAPFSVPTRVTGGRYPKVGVIDTGVCPALGAWIMHRHDFLDRGDTDPQHGSQVAGLLIAARSVNGPAIGREDDGCEIVDIPLMPSGSFMDVYGSRGFEAFLEELEAAISDARNTHGVRVFNMSLNIKAPVDADIYSIYAARLDEIQDRLGVVIVNSAGNLDYADWRAPWPDKATQALAALASRATVETILMPCESVRALAVGALNPPGSSHLAGAPATYTRRGPGLRVGVKPDLAHFGGTGDASRPADTHLRSCDAHGNSAQMRGTSFAAPLVAKTLAALDVATGERLEPRTLRAFLVHNSTTPLPLQNSRLREVARQFTGFGMPDPAQAMLETSDHAITLVFESRLTAGERRPAILRFPFAWPASLVDADTRACRGRVSMTLVYDAPLDQAFGTEFVRVNLNAVLRQRQPMDRKDGRPSFRDEISQAFLPRTNKLTIPERTLIEHGLKWWPTKRYDAKFEGVGFSTEWRLEVESVVRAEATFPAEGVPFSLILTIEDPDGLAPLFQEVNRQFQAQRLQMHDIRTAQRVRSRGRRS
ncbi:MAG: S8 family peptidase [Rhizobium sp.]|nr:S8 family peptidase [Rhizobium sp.]